MRVPLDAAVVPALLLLIARDLLLHDPPRILAWRLLHDPRLPETPSWLAALLPRATPGFDRDPIGLALAAIATGAALLYLALSVFGTRPRWRALLIGVTAGLLVVGPSAAFVAVGLATDRPYGQDGGVVQLPLALDKILAGESPYGADYSDSILGQQARSSAFWEPFGGNPILHHHAYLPGTHAVMMPFYLGSRALFGAFDPRFVTLLGYGLAVFLATRLVEGPARRLTAAGIAALNPLVYWHQIFGANDLLFVALLLAAFWAAESRRPLLAGVVLGLACATKQLAWPFAPFLLLHLSGARQWSDLRARSTWARLLRPLGLVVATFAVVVAPVAALDPKAFYGDIVVYNVGLPGADNYPLGGTPGFGFANILIYLGRVSSLRDYFPFGLFYVLLVPLGLALVHVQLREGGLGRALLNGNVALLASLYFSRVVHPNYLIPLAVLLPVALLMWARRADGAIVPLALLASAVEIVEHGVFRATWDQAVAAGLPRTLTGIAAALGPRSGPGLTGDPIGMGLSAVAAGLALAYLVTVALGASARVRLGLGVMAAAVVVFLPTALMAGAWGRTGIRGQDRWVVQAPADASRLSSGLSPYVEPPPERPLGREAWSTSFRLEPPRLLAPDRPNLPPGGALLAAGQGLLGHRDPRWLTLAGLLGLLVLVWRGLPEEHRPVALGVLLLAPPVAFGAIFGSPATLALPLLVALAWASSGAWALAAGILAGTAAAVDPRAWVAVPFLLMPLAASSRALWLRGLQAAAVTFGLLCLPPVLLDGSAFSAALGRPPDLSPGLGLFNLILYRGAENEVWTRAVLALVPVVAAAAVVGLRGRARGTSLSVAAAAVAVLLLAFLQAGVSPEVVAIPIGLAALSLLVPKT